MNKFIISSSFIFVIIIHFLILNYFKTSKIQDSQTQDSKPILLQIAKIEPNLYKAIEKTKDHLAQMIVKYKEKRQLR